MKAGPLDRRITIQRKTTTYSESGEPVETWANLATRVSASMLPVKGEERFTAPQLVALEQIEFRTRYAETLAALTPQDRVIHPALSADSPSEVPQTRHIHDVIAVHEIGRREGLQIITTRRADATT